MQPLLFLDVNSLDLNGIFWEKKEKSFQQMAFSGIFVVILQAEK